MHRRARPGARVDVSGLRRPDLGDRATVDREGRRLGLADLLGLADRARPERDRVRSDRASTHRAVQALARHTREPAGSAPRRTVEEIDDSSATVDAARRHRTAHRMGPPRHTDPQPDPVDRPPQTRRTVTEVPRRRPGCEVHGRRRPTRSATTLGGRDARPDRAARDRVLRAHRRRHRQDERDPLAPRPGRQTPHRPLRPVAPEPHRTPPDLARVERPKRPVG